MISPTPEPAPNPEDGDSQHSPLDLFPEGFPLPEDCRNTVISRAKAIQKVRRTAVYWGEDNPKILQSSLMKCKDALKVGSDEVSLPEEDPLNNVTVWLVEMSGTFERRSYHRPTPGETRAPRLPATKAFVILRAADGLELGYTLSRD